MSGVPLLPCVVIGSSTLYLRRRVVVRFGEPIASVTAEGRVEREVLAARVRAAMEALLPDEEPMISRWRFGEQMSDWFILRSQVGPRKAYVEERLRAQATARTEAGGRG
jgi:1-acyl-sn-glycerol-3-phosphate acyltransferase